MPSDELDLAESTEGRGAQLVFNRADPRRGAAHTLPFVGVVHLRLRDHTRHPSRRRTHFQTPLTQRLLRVRYRQRKRFSGWHGEKSPGESKRSVVSIHTAWRHYERTDLSKIFVRLCFWRTPRRWAKLKCWWREWSSCRNAGMKKRPVRRRWPHALKGRRLRACL